uniref:Phospholipase B1 n=1 Tax=Chelydra serpentina TaxID=8475 RepID=A0A8C3SBS1_CHESE
EVPSTGVFDFQRLRISNQQTVLHSSECSIQSLGLEVGICICFPWVFPRKPTQLCLPQKFLLNKYCIWSVAWLINPPSNCFHYDQTEWMALSGRSVHSLPFPWYQAGNGAGSKPNDVLDVLTQYRGLSWSVGGDENITTVTTLANILREFNPSLRGYSIGKGNQDSSNAFLNQAVAGDRSENVPSQARKLVDLMKNDTRINFQEDWKLITLFIGGNDLCNFCNDPVHFSPDNFTNNIKIALDILHREVPRAFVNLVTVLYIVTLRDLYQEQNISCPRLIMRQLCPCVLNYDDNSTETKMLESFNRRYQEETHRLVESGRYDTKEDFTVVVQPFLQRVTVPKTEEGLPDSSYFAPDCFHFDQKAHSQAARALWNNMLEKSPISLSGHCKNKNKTNVGKYTNTWWNNSYLAVMEKHGSVPSSGLTASLCLTVHALKPADVRVIAALGDSLTVRSFVLFLSFVCLLVEQQNVLPAQTGVGAGEEELNILREFNLNLTGYSTGTGGASEPNAFLNQAVSGAMAEKLPDQVRALVRLMKSDPRIDFNADWKIITVLIGANDLCNYCKDPVSSRIEELAWHCNFHNQMFLDNQVHGWWVDGDLFCLLQNSTRKLVESGRYDTQENFTVVLQPFFQNTKIPLLQDGRADISFLAPDCFHLNQKSQSQLSRALWNTMVGMHKPFLGTYRNSNYTYPPLEPTNKPIQVILRPTDIKIIAALGDSLTTAVGAKATSLNDLQTAWRGLSWSAKDNQHFNPELFGFSTGTEKETAGFNSAVGGAKANNMSTQARELVEIMRGSSKINFKEDWKVITLFVGGNDLCHYCLDRLPRAFVNLVEIMEIAGLRQIEKETSGMLMANSGRYAQREDFTVVVQPFFRNTIIPLDSNGKPDLSFFSVDCFHFTERGHAEMAIALWNSMVRGGRTDPCIYLQRSQKVHVRRSGSRGGSRSEPPCCPSAQCLSGEGGGGAAAAAASCPRVTGQPPQAQLPRPAGRGWWWGLSARGRGELAGGGGTVGGGG